MKVCLRVPTNSGIHEGVANWLVYVAQTLPTADIATTYTSCFGIAEGRNDIVREFLQTDCTHLWMVDSDTIPPRSVGLLDRVDELPVLCGPYMGWRGDRGLVWHVYNGSKKDKNGNLLYGVLPQKRWPKERFFKVDVAGTGCMVLQRQVIESNPRCPNIFYHVRHDDGSKGTEDFTFCRDCGGVWIDQYYRCEHRRDVPLTQVNEWIKLSQTSTEPSTGPMQKRR